MTNVFPALCADDVAATRDFYVDLLGFDVIFDSGWYVQLAAPDDPTRQVGIVERTHETVPEGHRRPPAGVLVSVEVDDVDAVHRRALEAGHPILRSLRDEDFGQRHFITRDPAGTMVDVITPIEASPEVQAFGVTQV
ncbi:MAG: VOC family protein [Thermoanaerobacterales bacterium]|jgi:catechol 2,3-dioxygenase-like lactoylglutathione lyase family enzyme|nr:glyoxalase [Thermoanaerobacterales bacterium]